MTGLVRRWLASHWLRVVVATVATAAAAWCVLAVTLTGWSSLGWLVAGPALILQVGTAGSRWAREPRRRNETRVLRQEVAYWRRQADRLQLAVLNAQTERDQQALLRCIQQVQLNAANDHVAALSRQLRDADTAEVPITVSADTVVLRPVRRQVPR